MYISHFFDFFLAQFALPPKHTTFCFNFKHEMVSIFLLGVSFFVKNRLQQTCITTYMYVMHIFQLQPSPPLGNPRAASLGICTATFCPSGGWWGQLDCKSPKVATIHYITLTSVVTGGGEFVLQ